VPWERVQKPWHDISVEYCEVCGNLLIHRFWRFAPEPGVEIRACSEECEPLYARLRRSTDEASTVAPG
jgi:hypothetical protein